jgi:hypothetical protein
MQLAALLRNDRKAGLGAAMTLALGLLAGSLGCGGSSNNETVVLPPGGEAIGELVCAIASSVPGDVVVQGTVIEVTFRLTDVNQRLVGQYLSVSFEAQGGHVPDPPDVTDENGEVTVFLVTDPDYVGEAFLRLIQPENDLRCDVTFRLVQQACVVTAEIQDDLGGTLDVGCGSSVMMTRDMSRNIIWTVTRPHHVTGALEPVAGAYLLVSTSGQPAGQLEIGPTDANGMITIEVSETGDVALHPTQVGPLVVTAEVIIADANMDGLEDALPCNSCSAEFEISDPPCDNDGTMVAVAYPYMSVLRPGEIADLSLTLTRGGNPIANADLLVSAQNGSLNGSALPVTISTDASGNASIAYEPFVGFGGTIADPAVDVVTFEAAASAGLQCVLTGEVNVATCGLGLAFAPAAQQGVISVVTATVTNVDTATTDGRMVSLDALGGTLLPPTGTTGPLAVADFTINVQPGDTTQGTIAMSFIDGYPCETVTATFDVLP